jgi:hypothetical protein
LPQVASSAGPEGCSPFGRQHRTIAADRSTGRAMTAQTSTRTTPTRRSPHHRRGRADLHPAG